MFICAHCNKFSQPHETPARVVVEQRLKSYPRRPKADGKDDFGGEGYEIVREVVAHAGDCATAVQNTGIGQFERLQETARQVALQRSELASVP